MGNLVGCFVKVDKKETSSNLLHICHRTLLVVTQLVLVIMKAGG